MDGFGQFVWTAAAIAAGANFVIQLCLARRRLLVSLMVAAIPVLYVWTIPPALLWPVPHLGFAFTLGGIVYAFTVIAAAVGLLAAVAVRSVARVLSRRLR